MPCPRAGASGWYPGLAWRLCPVALCQRDALGTCGSDKELAPGRFRDGDDGGVFELLLQGDGVEALADRLDAAEEADLELSPRLPLHGGADGKEAGPVLAEDLEQGGVRPLPPP